MVRMLLHRHINKQSKIDPNLPQFVCGDSPILKPILTPVTLLQRPSAHLFKNAPHFHQPVPVSSGLVHAGPEKSLRCDQISWIFSKNWLFKDTPHAHVHLILDGRLRGAIGGIIETCVRHEVSASEFVEVGAGIHAGIHVVHYFHCGSHAAWCSANGRFAYQKTSQIRETFRLALTAALGNEPGQS